MKLICDELCNQGYAVRDNFLSLATCNDLFFLATSLKTQNHFHQAKIGRLQDSKTMQTIRGDQIAWLDQYPQEPAVQSYLNTIQELTQILNHELFLGLKEFESHFAIYPKTTFYKKHKDQFQTTNNRKISCVYYLNPDWHPKDGGELVIYEDENTPQVTIAPINNRFCCFTSDKLHEVLITHKERYSITGWLKT